MPGKVAWLALEEDPELEFEFFLADRLSMTVRQLRQEMDGNEFLLWSRFHSRRAAEQEIEAARMG